MFTLKEDRVKVFERKTLVPALYIKLQVTASDVEDVS